MVILNVFLQRGTAVPKGVFLDSTGTYTCTKIQHREFLEWIRFHFPSFEDAMGAVL